MIIICAWKACAYNSEKGKINPYLIHGFCSNKHGVIAINEVDTGNEDDEYLECSSFRWEGEPDNIDNICE